MPTESLEIHDTGTIPPPTVAGATRWPYPRIRSSWDRDRLSSEWDEHVRLHLPSLEPGTHGLVGLRGFPKPLYRREPARRWTTDREAVAAFTRFGQEIELLPKNDHSDDWLVWHLDDYLRDYLDDSQWFAPTLTPSLTTPLEAFLSSALAREEPRRDEIYPGERAYAESKEERWNEEPYQPWRSRTSRRDIELMIRTTGRTTPYRLRPLVLITENGARKRWYYGGWAVYDVLPSGHVGACLAIYGKTARAGYGDTWHGVAWKDGYPRPLPIAADRGIEWRGWWMTDGEGYTAHAEVQCALTGESLAHGGARTPESDRRGPECFLPAEPPAFLEGGEHDEFRLVRAAV